METTRAPLPAFRVPALALVSAATALALGAASCRSSRTSIDDDRTTHTTPIAHAPALASDGTAARPESRPDPATWRLEDVFERVSNANPTARQALARLGQAAAAVESASAAWWPEFSLGVAWTHTDQPSMAFANLLDQHAVDFAAGFDPVPGGTTNWHEDVRLSWMLLAPGRRDTDAAAAAGLDEATAAAAEVERRLANAALQAWLGWHAASAAATVARTSAEALSARLDETRTRFEAGAALRVDVLRLEAAVAAARQEETRAFAAVSDVAAALNVLMGRPATAPFAAAPDTVTVGADLPNDLEGLIARANARRLDLSAAEHRRRRLQAEVRAAHSGNSPSIQAFAQYGFDGDDPALDTDLDSHVLGVSLRWPFTRSTGARVDAAEARLGEANAALDELLLAVGREVHEAWNALGVATATRTPAESAERAAEEAWRIVAQAQQDGASTVTDVLAAEQALRRARTDRILAESGERLARARLVAATGGVR